MHNLECRIQNAENESSFYILNSQFCIQKSGAVYFLWHYPSGRLAASPPASIPQNPPSCVGGRGLRGIAPFGVRTFLPRLAPGAILRPSKIAANIARDGTTSKPF